LQHVKTDFLARLDHYVKCIYYKENQILLRYLKAKINSKLFQRYGEFVVIKYL